jgi:hypothetical protein
MSELTENGRDIDSLRNEILDIKAQTEASSFTITSIKSNIFKLTRKANSDRERNSYFMVGVLIGLVAILCAIWWAYYDIKLSITDSIMLLQKTKIEAQLKESGSCITTRLHNSDN